MHPLTSSIILDQMPCVSLFHIYDYFEYDQDDSPLSGLGATY